MLWVHLSHDDPTAVEVNWMWLPSFIGQSHHMMSDLSKDLTERFKGRENTDETLQELHQYVMGWIQEKYKLEGLREYLAGIENVKG